MREWRKLYRGITTSDKLALVSDSAYALFTMLVALQDDAGQYPWTPAKIKSLTSTRPWTLEQTNNYLAELVDAALVVLVGGMTEIVGGKEKNGPPTEGRGRYLPPRLYDHVEGFIPSAGSPESFHNPSGILPVEFRIPSGGLPPEVHIPSAGLPPEVHIPSAGIPESFRRKENVLPPEFRNPSTWSPPSPKEVDTDTVVEVLPKKTTSATVVGGREYIDKGEDIYIEEEEKEEKKEQSKKTVPKKRRMPQPKTGEELLSHFTEAEQHSWLTSFPGINYAREATKCVDWWLTSGKTMKRPKSAFDNWLGNAVRFEQERGVILRPAATNSLHEYVPQPNPEPEASWESRVAAWRARSQK